MLRMLAVATLLLLPGSSRAEQVWRWTGSDGRVHYSNDQSLAPADAEVVRTQIRIVPSAARRPGAGAMRPSFVRPARVSPVGCGLAYEYIVLNNPHELADQVKQASLLDALGVPWRIGACR